MEDIRGAGTDMGLNPVSAIIDCVDRAGHCSPEPQVPGKDKDPHQRVAVQGG